MSRETPRHLGTSLRSRAAAQTIADATRLVPRLGITSVADVTPLDHLGLPVFMSVRPSGRIAQVHSGKGLLAEDAKAGALMEAVEFAACEAASAAAVVQRVSVAALQSQWPSGLRITDFAPRLGMAHPGKLKLPAVACELLQTSRSVLIPAELVLQPGPRQRRPLLFGSSSNGLASGNTLEEATLHALLEVIERDTVAMHIARDDSQALVTASLPRPFDAMARGWRRRGVRLHVLYLPNAIGLPCFEVGLHEPGSHLASTVMSRGWGLHFDRQIALSRALCEAAQSRLSAILANRPELPASAELARRLGAPPAAERVAKLLARFMDKRRCVRLETVPDEVTPSIRWALQTLLKRLPAVGLGPVFRHRCLVDDNPAALGGLQVVKLVVARSETPVGEHLRIGPRLMARLQGA